MVELYDQNLLEARQILLRYEFMLCATDQSENFKDRGHA